jgi:hypothetical protein
VVSFPKFRIGFVEPHVHWVCRLLGFQIVQDGVGLAAHLNHYWEVVYPEKKDHQKAAFIVGKIQLDCPCLGLNKPLVVIGK